MAELVAKIDSKMTQKKSRGRCHQPLEEYLQTNEQNKTKKAGRLYSSLLKSKQMFWKNLTPFSIFNNYLAGVWRG